MGIVNKIKSKLGLNKKETLLLKPKQHFSELVKQINSMMYQRNAELEARNLAGTKQVDALKKKISKKEEKKEKLWLTNLRKSVKNKDKEIEARENANKVRFKVEKEKIVFMRNNRSSFGKFKWFHGFDLYQLDGGQYMIFPLLSDGRTVKRLQRGVCNFHNIFKEKDYIVSQLKAGTLHSNFEISKNTGDLLLLVDEDEPIEDIKLVMNRFRIKIDELKQELNGVYNQLSKARKREASLLTDMNKYQIAAEVNDFTADNANALMTAAMEKTKAVSSEYGLMSLAGQDAVVNMGLAKNYASLLKEALERRDLESARKYSSDMEVLRRQELIEDGRVLAYLGNQFAPAMREEVPKKQKPEKGEKDESE